MVWAIRTHLVAAIWTVSEEVTTTIARRMGTTLPTRVIKIWWWSLTIAAGATTSSVTKTISNKSTSKTWRNKWKMEIKIITTILIMKSRMVSKTHKATTIPCWLRYRLTDLLKTMIILRSKAMVRGSVVTRAAETAKEATAEVESISTNKKPCKS